MFKNYIITAFRNFRRNAVFSAINITGLAIGISASLVIYLVVSYDFSFDKFEKNSDRVYRVVSNMKFPGTDFKNAGVPLPLIPAAQKELTGVELFVPITTADFKVTIEGDAKKPANFKKQEAIVYTTDSYFNLVEYEWLAGAPVSSLKEPNSVVLTESRAKTYFPNDQDLQTSIGKTIVYNDTIKATVTGIVKDITKRTDFIFKEFISYKTLPANIFTGAGQWGSVSSSDQLFVRLAKGKEAQATTKKIQQLFKKNQRDAYLDNIFSLQPLSDIHFNDAYSNFNSRVAHKPTLNGLLIVAAIILLLGCINFINLTTAQAVKRAKEIGIRKTMGSSKKQLISQFLVETFLLTITATFISVALAPWIIKLFSDFIPPGIQSGMLASTGVVAFVIVLIAAVTLLSGFYPSLVLSGFNPVMVLKNNTVSTGNTRRLWIRKSLTVSQFVVAQSFIIAALIVGSQIRYMLNKDLGFNKEGIITIATPFDYNDLDNPDATKRSIKTRHVLLQQILAQPGVQTACLAGTPPAHEGSSMQTMKYKDGKKELETTVEIKYADEDYLKVYKIQLLAGRFIKQADSLQNT